MQILPLSSNGGSMRYTLMEASRRDTCRKFSRYVSAFANTKDREVSSCRVTVTPGSLWQRLETFLVVTSGESSATGSPVGRDQGCCWISYNAQGSPQDKEQSHPKYCYCQGGETLGSVYTGDLQEPFLSHGHGGGMVSKSTQEPRS